MVLRLEKVFNMVWIVSCTAPLHRIVSADRQYLCSTYFAIMFVSFEDFEKKIVLYIAV
jgi:hypothetical protein